MNVVMKGGTNDFHGSLYEFNQVSALKATQFFTNAAGQKKAVTRFNQYGGTVGGPIILPKIFNGRNKLFFFFAYEGIRQSEPEPTFSTVPTAAQRNGDFSALLTQGSSTNSMTRSPACCRTASCSASRSPATSSPRTVSAVARTS